MAKPFFTLRGVPNPTDPKLTPTEKKRRSAVYKKLASTDVPIIVQMRCADHSDKYVRSTGETIQPKHWSFKDQRAKSSLAGAASLNDLLDTREKELKDALKVLKSENTPVTPASVQGVINRAITHAAEEKAKTENKLEFFPWLDEFIKECEAGIVTTKKGDPITDGTIKNYRVTRRHLKEFSEKKKHPITFTSIDKDLYKYFTAYLRNTKTKKTPDGLSKNYIGSQVKNLKHFLIEAEDDKRCAFSFEAKKHFVKVAEEETDSSIPLNDDQIMKMWNCEAVNARESYKRVRDRFVANCAIGLRVSDLKRLRKNTHITKIDGIIHIKIRDQKNWNQTGAHSIPVLNPVGIQILEEYDYELPNISDQRMNETIKEVAKLAGLNDPVTITRTHGTKRVEETVELWQIISTKFARKSWATNLVAAGIDRALVKEIGGWRSWAAFDRYVKLTPEQKAKLLQIQMQRGYGMTVVHKANVEQSKAI